MNALREHQALVLVLCMLAAFVAVSRWEQKHPARPDADRGSLRWTANFGLFASSQLLIFLGASLGAGLAAPSAVLAWPGSAAGSGLPLSLCGILLAVLVLDALGYAVHGCLHRVGLLWRVHQAHHSDLHFDASLGFRFHPLEVLLMSVLMLGLVALTGMPPEGPLAYGLINAAHNAFAHANAHLGPAAERLLRLAIVTPDLHRVHHAADIRLSNRNYAIVFSFWDRLFGTWHPASRDEPASVGLAQVRDPARLGLGSLLSLPLHRCDAPDERRKG